MASKISPEKISISQSCGWIDDKSDGCVSDDQKIKNSRLIININDAHCDYSAQKNLAAIIESLVKNYGVKLIALEGGSGYCGLDFLKKSTSEDKRKKVAERFLMDGKISGAEYLNLTTDYDILLWGVEDSRLYDANIKIFYETEKIKEEFIGSLVKLESLISEVKNLVYSEEFLEFESKVRAYRSMSVSLASFCGYLGELAKKKLGNFDKYRCFKNYFQSFERSKEIDFAKVQDQLSKVLNILSNASDENKQKTLLHKIESFRKQELAPDEFYSYIKAEATQCKIDLAEFEDLNRYILQTYAAIGLNKGELFDEIEQIISGLAAEMTKDSFDAAKLYKVSRTVDLLIKLGNLELSFAELKELNKSLGVITDKSQLDSFLNGLIRSNKLQASLPNIDFVRQNLKCFLNFYKIAQERNEAFVFRLISKMDKEHFEIACLITGGFHADGLKELLKENNCEFVTVLPLVKEGIDKRKYVNVLKEKSPIVQKNIK